MDLSEKDVEVLWHPMVQHSVLPAKGLLRMEKSEGCYVVDSRGISFFDGISGLWCVNVGYGRTELAQTAKEQMEELAYFPLTMSHSPAIKLAAKLIDLLDEEGKIFFSNSGSEGNEVAFKLARQYHGQSQKERKGFKYKIISRYRGYHGNTMGALSATAQAERKSMYEPLVPGFLHIKPPYCYRCPFGSEKGNCKLECAQTLEDTIIQEGASSVAAFIMEPIIAGGGVIVPPDAYIPRIKEICEKHDVLLIMDEVVTGFGRTGKMFGHEHWGVKPDLMTMAKGISSGYMPLSATFAKQHIFEAFLDEPGTLSHFRHVNTYGGHPVATAVGLHNIEILEDESLAENAAVMGDYIMKRLKEIDDLPIIGEIRGRGLLIGIELVSDKMKKTPLDEKKVISIVAECLARGFIIGRNTNTTPGFSNVLIIAPPLIITKEQADELTDTIKASIETVYESMIINS